MLHVVWSKAARKRLSRLDVVTRARLETAVASFATDGRGDVVPLVGRTGFRLRVGDWRVLFTVDAAIAVMSVEQVKPRGDAYK